MRKWALAMAAVLLLLSACSDKGAGKSATENSGKKAAAAKKQAELPFAFPLTGIASQTPTGGRAFAVMVNNHPKARPQSGLNKADIVYELLAEGDVTRFLAIFQSEKPETVGPIRSARDYYINLAKGLDSIFIAHGYSVEAKEMLNSGVIDHLNGMAYDGTLFKRADFRQAPHNSYIAYENMVKGSKMNGFDMSQTPESFKFLTKEEEASLEGPEALAVEVSYFSNDTFTSVYRYDSELGKYKRYSNGELTSDLDSGEPVLLDNIFIAEMDHKAAGPGGLRDIDLKSGGKGFLLQKGKVAEVDWLNDHGRIVPIVDGNEARLVRGKTWVNIVPSNPGLASVVSFEENL
ncbi:DUF3048 domain-containing protein [Neobacillus notoginsengisoli]|uniref:DUF3048 domain-containing protein n=1 Tax=Neobacillus notoginsengisoli TaxID=1578198 RepID=A0A417YHT0_9BACI|nr:DUF3048 domain-containing protein [Neobacillus notoginsengisoli]RHW32478.1 DUF3048 domain-containing protein [Neobacillus notoginsengisoli]